MQPVSGKELLWEQDNVLCLDKNRASAVYLFTTYTVLFKSVKTPLISFHFASNKSVLLVNSSSGFHFFFRLWLLFSLMFFSVLVFDSNSTMYSKNNLGALLYLNDS